MKGKTQSFKLQGANKTTLIGCGTFIALLVLGYFVCDSLTTTSTSPLQTVNYVTLEGSLERYIEEVFVATMGAKTNWEGNPQRLIAITKIMQVAGIDSGGYSVRINYRLNENLTTSLIKRGIFIESQKFYQKLYSNPRCSQVKICTLEPFAILTDKYGNDKECQVGAVRLRRAVAKKINWNNIYTDLFEKLLREDPIYWIHPALEK